ncbi:M15 family metallopeptidase [Streptomyces sp. NPDC093252]|uniref:M15 family metallopeptidase n=1 Tax=Streptomyces sp. NPDC093252 TaxID=3154980 RepID=UPI00342393D7
MTQPPTTPRALPAAFTALLILTATPAPVPPAPAAPAPTTPASAFPAPAHRTSPHPPAEPTAPKDFVALRTIDRTIIEDIRYTTPHNFVGDPIDGYHHPLCLLTRPAAQALHKAQRTLLRQGYSLKVYDCYRPQRAVDHFVRWAEDLDDEAMKREFYPDIDKSRLFADGYIAKKSGHSRGSTVDLTLVPLPARPTRPCIPGEPLVPCHAPQSRRFPDNSVDMATGYNCFDTLSHTLDPRVQGPQRAHRLLLKDTLEDLGFVNLTEEWWHFTHRPEPYPATYFDFPVAWKSLTKGT